MTEAGRAAKLIYRVASATDPAAAIAAVLEDFEGVRLAERAAIVAYLRRRYVADSAADRIERGEHGS